MGTKSILGAVSLSFPVAFLVAAAAACGGEDAQMAPVTPAPTATTPPPPPPVAVVPPPKPTMLEMQIAFEKVYSASYSDPDKIAALYAPDVVVFNIGDDEIKGREANLANLRTVLTHFDGLTMGASRMWTKGNTMVLQYVANATEKASGKPVSLAAAEVFTFNDDGLVVTDHSYADFEIILEQTGMYKGPHGVPPLLPLPTILETHNAKNDATEQANTATLIAAQDAARKNDDKAYFGFIANDLAWYDFSQNGVPPRDKKFLEAGTAAGRKSATTTSIKDVNVIAVEDFTIDEQEYSFTQKAAYSFDKMHLPNTKKSVTIHALEIDQWRDGKMQTTWNFTSIMELDRQLGTGPAAKPAAPAKPAKPAAKK